MRPFGSDSFILLIPAEGENEENLRLMRRIDEQYTKVPFYRVRRLTAWLRVQGYIVNPKRVRVLMRRMGLQAIFPHKRRSFSLYGLIRKGIFSQQCGEATPGPGIPRALWGIFWTYSQQKVC